MLRFDAYSATTTEADHDTLLQLVGDTLTDAGVSPMSLRLRESKGFHTFGRRIGVSDDSGAEVASVMWGGRQGERAMIEVKGEHTPGCVKRLRERFRHRCTRGDVCADFDAPRAFEGLLEHVLAVKADHRLYGEQRGDWQDHPEMGRTFYLGATASPLRARLYEKGRQPEYRHLERPNWARLELQVRPSKDAKDTFSTLEPGEFWGASKWTRDLAARALAHHVDPHPAGTTWRVSERERALAFMCKQYGAHLVSLAADLGGWEVVGLTLNEIIKEQRQ